MPEATQVEARLRANLSTIVDKDKVVAFCKQEQLSLNEICALGSAKEIAVEIDLKLGDAVRLRRLSEASFKAKSKPSNRKRKNNDTKPIDFRIEEKHWFQKGNRNLNTPERTWLKSLITKLLDNAKVKPCTTYYGLLTDKESEIKDEIIRAQHSEMKKRLALRGTDSDTTATQYESVFRKLLSNEICASMKDRVKNYNRKAKKARLSEGGSGSADKDTDESK